MSTQVAFIARNPKVARAARQKVLNRLVIDELGRAAAQTGLPGAEAVAKLAAAPELRAACVAAARAAEMELYNRCKSTAVRIAAGHPCLVARKVHNLVYEHESASPDGSSHAAVQIYCLLLARQEQP